MVPMLFSYAYVDGAAMHVYAKEQQSIHFQDDVFQHILSFIVTDLHATHMERANNS